jgi:hypothetical protein
MKYTIELDQEMKDRMFRQIIVEDYHMLCNDVKSLKRAHKTSGLENYQLEDLHDSIRWRKALKTMIRYYFSHEEANKIIGERHD